VISNLKLLWEFPPNHWNLSEADVHIWAASLEVPIERIVSLERTLSSDERGRAKRFHFERDQRRFVAGRGILREILSSYLTVEPAQLRFDYGSSGKPFLATSPEGHNLNFNLSHSADLMLIALTRSCMIGVDVEWMYAIEDIEKVASHLFSIRQLSRLMALSSEQRLPAFFSGLTRKEAYLKATGAGLTDAVRQIEVSFLANETAPVLTISGDPQAAACWTLIDLAPAPGFIGAVAVEEKDPRPFCWQWPV
jgi:4'-phosphopantetheinyl transferase